ncbi:hypothetical protein BDV93DRAFT_610903 [Ceratobasidium sp. AG-I]|nr:hypothetical protein BDV93DRAFT_610903 [Ceratobasidium sp. AG-I]
MSLTFEYPLTRQYPWRFTTLLVLVSSFLVLSSLVYINVATVGMTSYTKYSPVFIPWQSPSQLGRLNIRTMENYDIGCESATLVTGGAYQTSNGLFTYTVQSLYSQTSQGRISNANYNGSTLESCFVDKATVSASLSNFEATFEATVNCSLPGNLEMIVTTNNVVRIPSEDSREGIDSRASTSAQSAGRLLAGAGSDFFYEDVFTTATLTSDGNPQAAIIAFSFPFRFGENSTIEWLKGSRFVTASSIQKDPGPVDLKDSISDQSDTVLENYLRIFYSAILSDLGIASQSNVMTDTDLFRRVIQPTNFSSHPAADNKSEINAVLANLLEYKLPLTSVQPSRLNSEYLCHYYNWKTRSNLVMDVCVATASLFMAFWSSLAVVLASFARKDSGRGNYCTCDSCNIVLSREKNLSHGDTLSEQS